MLSPMLRRARRSLDDKLSTFKEMAHLSPPKKGWIRATRDALGMSAAQLARRLEVTASQSVDDLERSEAAGAIRLDSLRRAAEAMDCTLVYALVPNTSLEQIVETRAREIAREAIARVDQTMALEAQGVAADREELIRDYIRDHVTERAIWTRP